MRNQTRQWAFVEKASRPALTASEAAYWKEALRKLLKAGIEVEYNLPQQTGSCAKQNYFCVCTKAFSPEPRIPGTAQCHEQCAKWNGGACELAQQHGCAAAFCVDFQSPCSACRKYDRGCASCPDLYDAKKDPRHIRAAIGEALQPTRFVGRHGAQGVYKVCKDGSLRNGGVEVATVGKRVQFQSLYAMIKKIMDLCYSHGAYVDERCSTHIHLLASYLTPSFTNNDKGGEYLRSEITEMEKPMPEVILANFHQLFRRYHCAFIWLGAAGNAMQTLTRWEKFRKPILQYSAIRHRMDFVAREVAGASKHKPKYSIMNYEPVVFDEDGNVSRFHVEARHMDGVFSPAAVTAHVCLVYGLLLKAVEISRHGLLKSGDHEYMLLQREMLRALCNNDGDWGGSRHSDTGNIDPHIPRLIEQSHQLVRLVKSAAPELSPADDILQALAEEPIALRRIKGASWEEIEEALYPTTQPDGPLAEMLGRLIETAAIIECDSKEEWLDEAAHEVARAEGNESKASAVEEAQRLVGAFISKGEKKNSLFWSEKLGGYIRSH